jgi:hypothetical protein
MKNGKKVVPSFWWDFANGTKEIIVESDSDAYPVLARISIPDNESGDEYIEKAEKIITALNRGWISMKGCFQNNGLYL